MQSVNNRIFKTTKELTPFITEMINKEKSVQLTVTGNSMFPLFAHLRDSVVVRKSEQYKKYDIILYVRTNGDLILHRIVDVKDGVFYLCGDNQTLIEYPIYKEQVIGKVVSFTRKNKNSKINSFFPFIYSRLWCFNINLRPKVLRFLVKIWRRTRR